MDRRLRSPYELELSVVGQTARSLLAIRNIWEICEEYLPNRYGLTVTDILKHPAAAKREQILVVPTLIKCTPLPVRRLVGDFSKSERVLKGLDLAYEAQGSSSEIINRREDLGWQKRARKTKRFAA